MFEGNFKVDTHRALVDELLAAHPDDNYFFYLDVSLQETVRRHSRRPERISVDKMREIYPSTAPLGDPRERLIAETASADDAVRIVLEVAGL